MDFAYSRLLYIRLQGSHHYVIYTSVPRHVVDLIKLPKAPGVSAAAGRNMTEEIIVVKEAVKAISYRLQGKKKNVANKCRRAKVFSVGDDVMVFLRKKRFPFSTYNKLKPRKYGPFKVTCKINDNPYVVALPDDMNISNTFSIAHIYEYHGDEVLCKDTNSRSRRLM